MSNENVNEVMGTDSAGKSDVIKKFSNKKWGIIGGIAVVLFALIVGIGLYNTPANRLTRQLDLGNRYLEEQNYEQAIVEFDKAIAIDPMSVDAYLGKADAYIGMDDLQSALDTLQTGYDLTGDERLKMKLNEINAQLYQNSQVGEATLIEEEADLQEGQDYIELPFSFLDIKIKGYDLREPHLNEIAEAFGCPINDFLLDTSYGYMYAYSNETDGVCGFHYGGNGGENNGGSINYSYNLVDDAYPNHLGLGINGYEGKAFLDGIKSSYEIPVEIGDTYEECCRKLGEDIIKNASNSTYNNDYDIESWELENVLLRDNSTNEPAEIQSIYYMEWDDAHFYPEGEVAGNNVALSFYDSTDKWMISIWCPAGIVEDVSVSHEWR